MSTEAQPIGQSEATVETQASTPAPLQFHAQGSSGIKSSSGIPSEEYLAALTGRKAADVYDKMRRSDSKIKKVLKAVKDPIKAASWGIEPAGDSDQEKLHAELIEHILFHGLDEDASFQQFLSEALTVYDFGHAVFEELHKLVMAHPKFGSYIGLRRLAWRSPRTIEAFNLKSNGGLASIKQVADGDLARNVDIDAKNIVVITLDREGDNYAGVSALRACYGPWLRKQTYLKLMAIGIEKYAVPTPVGKVPQTSGPDFETFKASLEAYTSHETNYMTLPNGWDVEFKENNFDPEKVRSAIDGENMDIVDAFLANFLELGMNGSGGAYSLSNDQSDFFLSSLTHVAQLICDAINLKVIPTLIKNNFGPQQAYPKLKCTGLTDKAGQELATAIKALVDGRVIVPDDQLEDNLRDRFALPKRSMEGRREAVVAASTAPAATAPTPVSTAAGTGEVTKAADTALNGAQVDSLLSIIQSVAGGTLPRDAAVNIIATAFNRSTEDADRMLGSVGRGFKSAAPAAQLSEEKIQLAERTAKKLIADGASSLEEVMRKNLGELSRSFVTRLMRAATKLSPDARVNAAKKVDITDTAAYRSALREEMAKIAAAAIASARKDVPKASGVKLAGETSGVQLSEFDKLPPNVKRMIDVQSELIISGQVGDLKKSVLLQFTSSVASTDSEAILEDDLLLAGSKVVDGAAVGTGAGTTSAQVTNTARLDFFEDPEVSDQVEAFQFVNGDPVSPICQDLAGTIFSKDDPMASRYMPPLHHNCKSYIVPILKGELGNKEVANLRPSKASLEKYITLGEGRQKS